MLCRSAALPLCRSAALPLCRSAALPLCRSAALPLCRSAALPLCGSAALPAAMHNIHVGAGAVNRRKKFSRPLAFPPIIGYVAIMYIVYEARSSERGARSSERGARSGGTGCRGLALVEHASRLASNGIDRSRQASTDLEKEGHSPWQKHANNGNGRTVSVPGMATVGKTKE